MPAITKRSIDQLIANTPPGGVATLRDDELRGFSARRNANGTVTFRCEYRPGSGGRGVAKRRIKIGEYGPMTPDEARRKAKATLGSVANGEDPAQDRSAKRKELTVGQWLEACVTSHWRAKRKKSTADAFEAMITRTLKPEFGNTKLSDLKRADIRAWHATQGHRPRQANLDLAILRRAMSLAVADDLIPANPVTGIAGHPEKARDRVPTDEEMKALWKAYGDADIRPASRLLFRLLTLTGCRRDEIRACEWSWVDTRNSVLRLPDTKTGAREIALPAAACALLAEADRNGPYVIPNETGERPLSPSRIHGDWTKVLERAEVTDLHLHDLRHHFATMGATMGASALLLRDALGHKTLAMTSRYVSRQRDPVQALADRIANQILALGEGPGGDNVTPLPKRRRAAP